ncbi:MAG: hypothetical protein ABL932_15950 [Terricaulis sp.]
MIVTDMVGAIIVATATIVMARRVIGATALRQSAAAIVCILGCPIPRDDLRCGSLPVPWRLPRWQN